MLILGQILFGNLSNMLDKIVSKNQEDECLYKNVKIIVYTDR